MYRSRQPNPFADALQSVGRAVQSVMKERVGPSPKMLQAMETFQRRMTDPEASVYELRAIKERHGVEGLLRYIDEMSKATEELE